MNNVKHNSIGVGLNCSKIIAESLGGDVRFLDTEPGKTSVRISLPVRAKKAPRQSCKDLKTHKKPPKTKPSDPSLANVSIKLGSENEFNENLSRK